MFTLCRSVERWRSTPPTQHLTGPIDWRRFENVDGTQAELPGDSRLAVPENVDRTPLDIPPSYANIRGVGAQKSENLHPENECSQTETGFVLKSLEARPRAS